MVDVLPRFSACQIVEEQALGGEVFVLDFIDLVLQVDDGFAVGRPAGVAAGLGHAGAAAAVDVLHIDVAAFRLARALLELKRDLLAVGRYVGVVLVVAGMREDDRVRTVGISHDQRPMAVAVAFVDDAVGVVLQLGEEFSCSGSAAPATAARATMDVRIAPHASIIRFTISPFSLGFTNQGAEESISRPLPRQQRLSGKNSRRMRKYAANPCNPTIIVIAIHQSGGLLTLFPRHSESSTEPCPV